MSLFKRLRHGVRNRLHRLLHDRGEVETQGLRLSTRDPAVTDKMFHALSHRYEWAEAELVTAHLKPEHRVLEVGAAIGFLACLCSKTLGVTRYAAVEANPRLIALMKKNLELNDATDVKVVNRAVAKEDGMISFTISEEFWASSTAHEKGELVEVEAQTLASLVTELDFIPDTLIMDIEGGELDIPLSQFLPFQRILMETHPLIVGAGPTDAMLRGFAEAGYVLQDRRGHVVFLSRD